MEPEGPCREAGAGCCLEETGTCRVGPLNGMSARFGREHLLCLPRCVVPEPPNHWRNSQQQRPTDGGQSQRERVPRNIIRQQGDGWSSQTIRILSRAHLTELSSSFRHVSGHEMAEYLVNWLTSGEPIRVTPHSLYGLALAETHPVVDAVLWF